MIPQPANNLRLRYREHACDTVKNLEREAAARFTNLTVEQAERLADNDKAKVAWRMVGQWTGMKAKITPEIMSSFLNLIR